MKRALIKKYKEEQPGFSLEAFFGENGTILKKNGTSFLFEDTPEVLVQKLNAHPFLREMGIIEHRRWCYSRAMDGWSFGTVKNEIKRESPYLVSWDELCLKNPEVCIYDYMAFLMLMTKKE